MELHAHHIFARVVTCSQLANAHAIVSSCTGVKMHLIKFASFCCCWHSQTLSLLC